MDYSDYFSLICRLKFFVTLMTLSRSTSTLTTFLLNTIIFSVSENIPVTIFSLMCQLFVTLMTSTPSTSTMTTFSLTMDINLKNVPVCALCLL